jgi:hypothetical protein
MKQRLACLVPVDFRDGIGCPSVEETATLLFQTGIIPTALSRAVKTVNAMIDTGIDTKTWSLIRHLELL